MIREVILNKRMPPWYAESYAGELRGDLSLEEDEAHDILRWIDAGSPRGTGRDPLLQLSPISQEWQLGAPDLVITFPEFTVPATGVVEYQFEEVATNLEKDVWIRAAQVIPGDAAVIHHVNLGVKGNDGTILRANDLLFAKHLVTYAPGQQADVYPENHGVSISQHARLIAQFHYTTSGKKTIDVTRVGLYFARTPPLYELQHHAIINPEIRIPPNTASHYEEAYFKFESDALIYSLFPHAHYRGKSCSFWLEGPHGERKPILSVPSYNFNWQRYFWFEEPVQVPAGTKLVYSTEYDNSEGNAGNPDPNRTVTFGFQSWDEMLYGGVVYRFQDESNARSSSPIAVRASLIFGYMDRDRDGLIVPREMSMGFARLLLPYLEPADAIESKGLDPQQLELLLSKLTMDESMRLVPF